MLGDKSLPGEGGSTSPATEEVSPFQAESMKDLRAEAFYCSAPQRATPRVHALCAALIEIEVNNFSSVQAEKDFALSFTPEPLLQ